MFTGRTISEIYNVMITEKITKSTLTQLQPQIDDHQTFLDDLKNTTKVAIWRSFIWLVAFQTYIFEQIMVSYQEEVDLMISNSYVGSVKWYTAKAKEFQTGYSLVFNSDYSIGYPTEDLTARIVEFAAGEESAGTFYLKVRRADTDILSVTELAEFQEYIRQIKFAGTRIIIRNEYSDKIKLYMNIVYNPQYNLDTLKTAVYAAINDYLANIEFDSTFRVNSLVDKLQLVEGVVDPQLIWTTSEVKPNSGSYNPLTYSYKPFSGYIEVDGSFPLTSTITFTKNS